MADAKVSAKPKPSLEEERDPDGPIVGPSGRKKVGVLSTAISRAAVISAFLICSVWVFVTLMSLERYHIMTVSNTNSISVFRIDQLKGDVHICTPQACTPVQITDVSGE